MENEGVNKEIFDSMMAFGETIHKTVWRKAHRFVDENNHINIYDAVIKNYFEIDSLIQRAESFAFPGLTAASPPYLPSRR